MLPNVKSARHLVKDISYQFESMVMDDDTNVEYDWNPNTTLAITLWKWPVCFKMCF